MILKLKDGTEFDIASVISEGSDIISIHFGADIPYESVKLKYDPYNNAVFSEDVLSRFEIFGDDGTLQGIHMYYTDVLSINAFMGNITVKIKQESKHESLTKSINDTTVMTTGDSLMIMEMLLQMQEQISLITTP